MNDKKNISKKKWKEKLTAEQFQICINKGTEPPYSGKYLYTKTKGTYKCICCGNPLFKSDTKFDSGSGWPSFFKSIGESNITTKEDLSHSMKRTEVICNHCNAHLGHIFEDGPEPSGLRYCINSVSLELEED